MPVPADAGLPIRLLLLGGPALAVAQFRALALAATVAFLATVLRHRLRHGGLPWPRGRMLAAVLALLGWGAISAAWAAEPGRALATSISLGGLALLGAAAGKSVAADPAPSRARLGPALAWGLGVGIALAAADHASGNAIRAALRGLREPPVTLYFGLKSAVSVIAVLLPVAVALPALARWRRALLAAAGLAAALALPADSAKLAAVAGLLALALAWRVGPVAGWTLGAVLAVLILAAPLLAGAVLGRSPALDALPRSAAHRVLIWDFTLDRIAERPLLGWGAEASRTVPGGRDTFAPTTLARFGLMSADARAWFTRPDAQRLSLHPHNAALQLWLELGVVGAAGGAALAWAMGRAAARAGPGATGALAAGAVVGLLSYGVWQEWWWGFVLLLMVTLAGRPAAPATAA